MKRRLALSAIVAAHAAFLALLPVSLWAAVGVLFCGHVFLVALTLIPNHQWFGRVVTGFRTNERAVWLTIDDGPGGEDTRELLDLLATFDARATFFLIGARVREHPGLVQEIQRRGHQVANHTETHPERTFWRCGPGRIGREIDHCAESIEGASGSRPTLFRAPVGMVNPFVHPVLKVRGLPLIGWSARGLDGRDDDPGRIVGRILKNVRPGAIVLVHQGRRLPGGGALVTACLRELLPALRERGYAFVLPSPGSWAPRRRNVRR